MRVNAMKRNAITTFKISSLLFAFLFFIQCSPASSGSSGVDPEQEAAYLQIDFRIDDSLLESIDTIRVSIFNRDNFSDNSKLTGDNEPKISQQEFLLSDLEKDRVVIALNPTFFTIPLLLLLEGEKDDLVLARVSMPLNAVSASGYYQLFDIPLRLQGLPLEVANQNFQLGLTPSNYHIAGLDINELPSYIGDLLEYGSVENCSDLIKALYDDFAHALGGSGTTDGSDQINTAIATCENLISNYGQKLASLQIQGQIAFNAPGYDNVITGSLELESVLDDVVVDLPPMVYTATTSEGESYTVTTPSAPEQIIVAQGQVLKISGAVSGSMAKDLEIDDMGNLRETMSLEITPKFEIVEPSGQPVENILEQGLQKFTDLINRGQKLADSIMVLFEVALRMALIKQEPQEMNTIFKGEMSCTASSLETRAVNSMTGIMAGMVEFMNKKNVPVNLQLELTQ
jgi:hypothetical protein